LNFFDFAVPGVADRLSRLRLTLPGVLSSVVCIACVGAGVLLSDRSTRLIGGSVLTPKE